MPRGADCAEGAARLARGPAASARSRAVPDSDLGACSADGAAQSSCGSRYGAYRGGAVDTLEVMKWRDIYEMLETATDRAEDVANIIEGIVLENS